MNWLVVAKFCKLIRISWILDFVGLLTGSWNSDVLELTGRQDSQCIRYICRATFLPCGCYSDCVSGSFTVVVCLPVHFVTVNVFGQPSLCCIVCLSVSDATIAILTITEFWHLVMTLRIVGGVSLVDYRGWCQGLTRAVRIHDQLV